MSDNYTTIYATCRRSAGLTQERAAELLGVATRTLAAWETGERIPPDIRVCDMVDLYGTPVLAIQHLRINSPLSRGIIPVVNDCSLPQAVCQLLHSIRQLEQDHAADRLLEIASDGRIDELEELEFAALLQELEPIVSAVLALRCARG